MPKAARRMPEPFLDEMEVKALEAKKAQRKEAVLRAAGGVELFCVKDLAGSPRAAVIIAHGLAEHHGRYDYFAGALNGFGFSVYRYDQRGHGKSGGERSFLPAYDLLFEDAKVVVEYARGENPGVPVFLFGHSMGALAGVGFCIKYSEMVNGAVLSGTLCADSNGQLKNIPPGLDPLIKIPNGFAGLLCNDPQVGKAYAEDPLVIKEIAAGTFLELKKAVEWFNSDGNLQKITCPVLILHGGGDLIVSPEDSRHLYASVSSRDREIRIYEGLYHEILNEKTRDEIIAGICAWIEKRLS
ncbi:MAG: lysophospholipase [Desulfotomaculales bacterium]